MFAAHSHRQSFWEHVILACEDECLQLDMLLVSGLSVSHSHRCSMLAFSFEQLNSLREFLLSLILQKQVTCYLLFSLSTAVIGSLQFGYNTGVINAPEQVCTVCVVREINFLFANKYFPFQA